MDSLHLRQQAQGLRLKAENLRKNIVTATHNATEYGRAGDLNRARAAEDEAERLEHDAENLEQQALRLEQQATQQEHQAGQIDQQIQDLERRKHDLRGQ